MEPQHPGRDEAIELIARVRNGEEQAFADFQRGYRRMFLVLLLSLNIPPFEAEDLVASAITDLLVGLADKWNPVLGSFDAWVTTVVRNRGREWLRRRTKAPVVSLPESFDPPQRVPERFDPARASAVHEAMLALSVSDRIVLEMREFENERPYKEIAEVLSRNAPKPVLEGAARVRHKRALERLEGILRADERIRFRHSELSKGEAYERIEQRRAG